MMLAKRNYTHMVAVQFLDSVAPSCQSMSDIDGMKWIFPSATATVDRLEACLSDAPTLQAVCKFGIRNVADQVNVLRRNLPIVICNDAK